MIESVDLCSARIIAHMPVHECYRGFENILFPAIEPLHRYADKHDCTIVGGHEFLSSIVIRDEFRVTRDR